MRLTALTRLRENPDPTARRVFADLFNRALDDLGVKRGEHFLLAHPTAIDERPPTPGRCSFCGTRINVNLDYRKVEGWEKRRAEGGTNALALREPHEDEWACTGCIERQKHGIAPLQGTMT